MSSVNNLGILPQEAEKNLTIIVTPNKRVVSDFSRMLNNGCLKVKVGLYGENYDVTKRRKTKDQAFYFTQELPQEAGEIHEISKDFSFNLEPMTSSGRNFALKLKEQNELEIKIQNGSKEQCTVGKGKIIIADTAKKSKRR